MCDLNILQTVEFSSAGLPMLREPTVQMAVTSVSRKNCIIKVVISHKNSAFLMFLF